MVKYIKITLVLLIVSIKVFPQGIDQIFVCEKGHVSFTSDAPLELIKASNEKLAGLLNAKDRSFSFRVLIKDFEGFNSSLQRVHFNEDYLETELFPSSTFKGRIIEETDLSVPGEYQIRAKGKLSIHGVEIDRIVRCDLVVTNKQIDVKASFTVFIADHNISIPSILNQKIAKEIMVDVKFTCIPSQQRTDQ